MRSILPRLMMVLLTGGILFGCAGRWDFPAGWVYVGTFVVLFVVAVRMMDPDLLRERLHPAPGGRDRYIRPLILPFFVAHLAIAGLDVGRFHWSDSVPLALQAVGFTGIAAASALSLWAMKVNVFFSPVIRIQHERGHRLATDGPYRWIRHPGYLAAMSDFVCSGWLLGSWWSLAPLLIPVLLILRRTVREDRFLCENLDGYRQYMERVRYRWLPGLW